MLNKQDLRILKLLSINEAQKSIDIAKKLAISQRTINLRVKSLQNQKLLTKSNDRIYFEENPLAIKLKEFILDKEDLEYLQGLNLELLILTSEEKLSLEELILKTGYKKSQVYNSIKYLQKRHLLLKEKTFYYFNNKLWKSLEPILFLFKEYKLINSNLPKGSIIIFQNKEKIIFQNDDELKDFQKTAFSRFSDFGIDIYYPNTYTNSSKELSIIEIFVDALDITKTLREKIYLGMFYEKNKNKIKNISHPILNNIKKVLAGERIENYPKREEIIGRLV